MTHRQSISNDDLGYSAHLVHGISWDQPTAPEYRKVMHAMGLRPRGSVTVGGDPCLDELTVLELGRHVEMEFSLQDMAAGGIHWVSLGDYLSCLKDASGLET